MVTYVILSKDGTVAARSKSLPGIRMKAVSYLKKNGLPYINVLSDKIGKGDAMKKGPRKKSAMMVVGIVEVIDDPVFYSDRWENQGKCTWQAIGSRSNTIRLIRSDGTLGERP